MKRPDASPVRSRSALAQGLLLASICMACIASPARADDDGKTLTGDWNGLRSDWLDHGVELKLAYISEVATNARGGDDEKTRYTDQWTLGAKLDLQKMLGWNGSSFQLTFTQRDGRNLVDDAHLQTLQLVQEVYGRGQTGRLTQLWFRQVSADKRFDLKLGRMTVGEDFAAFTCDFQNLSFCGAQPGNVRGELWYNWPVSQWGTRFKWEPTGITSMQVGLYQVDPRYIDDGYASHHGLVPDNPSGTTGALIPIEFAWSPKPGGLPGSYKAGAWYDSSNAADVYLDTNRQPIALTGGAPLQRGSRSGVYVNFSQRIIGTPAGRGATLFFNATQSDRSTATSMDRQVTFGLLYTGPFSQRPGDSIGIAIGSSHVNDRVADGLRLANALDNGDRPLPGSEGVGELFYAWVPRPYFRLQPNLQFIRHPGGIGSNASELIIGLRTSVDF